MNRIRKRFKSKLKTKIIIIILLIFSLTYFFMHKYIQKLNPNIITVAEQKINQAFRYFLSSNVGYELLKDVSMEEILLINKNQDGEILNVDFKLDRAYYILDNITNELTQNIYDLEQGNVTIKDNDIVNSNKGLILKFPLFLASKYALISNLGPKVYLKINFVGTLLTNIKTKITNYGLNSCLVELYVTVELTDQLVTPVEKHESKINYDVLIASKIINGRVPTFYGDSIVKEGSIMEKELN